MGKKRKEQVTGKKMYKMTLKIAKERWLVVECQTGKKIKVEL